MTGPKNTPKNRVGQAANMTRGYLREVKTITENASRTDKDGDWGLDAWVRIIHELVDLQVRTSAAVLQAALSGPWWTEPSDDEPQPSDPVSVDPTSYPRTLQAASAFSRVGLPQTKIPPYSIGFDPAVLPAQAAEFRVVLKDHRFIGANYTGTVRLTNATNPQAVPVDKEVTVGL